MVYETLYNNNRLVERYSDEEFLNFPLMTDVEAEIMVAEIPFRLFRIMFFAKNKDILPCYGSGVSKQP